jgi:peptidoglycan/LPS O-acetylase OafA/YrhL
MEGQKKHIATLDALRGIAALAVVIFHMTSQTQFGPFPPRSYLAVDFFFVLSGFVIARTYEDRLGAHISFWSFVRIRITRLYPLILLGTILGFTAKLGAYLYFKSAGSNIRGMSIILEALFFGIFLIPNKGMYETYGGMFALDSPVWSLMLEIWINLIYAATVRILSTPVLAFVVTSGAVAIGICAGIHHDLNGGFSLSTLCIGIARVWFSFFAGVLIHRKLPGHTLARIPRLPVALLAGVLILSFFPSVLMLGEWYEVATVIIVYPAIIILGASDPIAPRLRPIALMAGTLSYPMYILHWPTLTHFSRLQTLRGPSLIISLTLALFAAVGISYAANRWYDDPLRKWFRDRRRNSGVETLPRAMRRG